MVDATPRTGEAYAMVAQACAIAIQDAVAYLRNVQIVATAAIGTAQEQILEGASGADGARALAAAHESVAAALKNLNDVGATAAKLLAEFPQG